MQIEHNYTQRGIIKAFKDLFECIRYGWIKRMRFKVDITGRNYLLKSNQWYDRKEYWTDEKSEDLHATGYKPIEGLKNSLIWWGIPIYGRLQGFKTLEITDPNASKDTPMTLDDRMHSNLTTKFAKSLARATTLAGMDIQKMVLMGAIAVGAVLGMHYFGVF